MTKKLKVGDLYGGGIVFCIGDKPGIENYSIEGEGTCGLIMSLEDLANYKIGNVPWSSERKEIGASAQSLSNGATNTDAIIKAHPKDNPSNNAAWLCRSYRGGDFDDWYLPAKDELDLLYQFAKTKKLIGKNFLGNEETYPCYWSSSEYSEECSSDDDSCASIQNFHCGRQSEEYKDNFDFAVRAVRAFDLSKVLDNIKEDAIFDPRTDWNELISLDVINKELIEKIDCTTDLLRHLETRLNRPKYSANHQIKEIVTKLNHNYYSLHELKETLKTYSFPPNSFLTSRWEDE